MLAHLQKILTLLLVAVACAWLLYFWERSAALALGGFLGLLLGYSFFLACEFVTLRFVNRHDPAPQPDWRALVQAWWGEFKVAPQVFCWWQPFCSRRYPDELVNPALRGRRGVVLIHGFFCNRGFWTPWLKRLQGRGHAFVALNLEPVFGAIEDYAPLIDAAVSRVTQASGLPPLVVCHSMGGLAARAWLKVMQADHRVHRVVTIGSPHRGTWLARFSHGVNGRQMRLNGDWLAQLDQGMPATRPDLFTCWYSNCDNIVFPPSTATLQGADNRLVLSAAHVQLAFLPELMEETLAWLAIDPPARKPWRPRAL